MSGLTVLNSGRLLRAKVSVWSRYTPVPSGSSRIAIREAGKAPRAICFACSKPDSIEGAQTATLCPALGPAVLTAAERLSAKNRLIESAMEVQRKAAALPIRLCVSTHSNHDTTRCATLTKHEILDGSRRMPDRYWGIAINAGDSYAAGTLEEVINAAGDELHVLRVQDNDGRRVAEKARRPATIDWGESLGCCRMSVITVLTLSMSGSENGK